MRPCPQCGAECATEHRFCPACGFPIGALRTAAGDPLIGRTLGGAYVILEHVGSGGMGRVYRAEQASLGKTLAVKVIHPHLISDESATARFYTEARASSRLNHPNSVSVLDFGRTDDGLLYLVMEFLRGKDLAHVLWETGPLPPARVVNILKQVLASLAEAHDLGIIHRDIKPENIIIEPMRTGGDFVKVVDFGLAKVRADVAPSITTPGIVCGTPDYMAPEQGRGDPLDARTDLYACGVVLYQSLTNRVPYEADSPTQVVLMHMTDPIPDPRAAVPTVPEPMANMVLKSMAKDAKDRYQSAVEFADALDTTLREIERPLRNQRSDARAQTAALQTCGQCGAKIAVSVKFCSECGAKIGSISAPGASVRPGDGAAPASEPAPAITATDTTLMAFVGRERELGVLEAARVRAANAKLVTLRVQGEEGAGKHRLFDEMAARSRQKNDVVLRVEPDVTWSGVAYSPVVDCVRQCLAIGESDDPMEWLARRGANEPVPDRAVRAGFEELFGTAPPPHLEGRARREAVVRAVAFSLRHAASRAGSGVAVLLIERLHRMDSASRAVWSGLAAMKLDAPVLVMASHTPRMDPGWSRSDAVVLGALPRTVAADAVAPLAGPAASEVMAALDSVLPNQDVSPLFLDQLARWVVEGGGTPPTRLVDLVSSRYERLPPRARRVVQVLSVLGEADAMLISKVIGEDVDPATITALRTGGWVLVRTTDAGEAYRVDHPLMREVAELAIGAAARKELHARCAEALKGRTLPVEFRAVLSTHDDNPFEALILFDRLGDEALARGDDLGAAMALRRGLERARREMVRGEIDDPERAIAIFARKLGEALLRAGEPAEAEGVMREGLEVIPRSSVEWARLEGTLARALHGRGRTPDALRAIDEALRVARRLNARSIAAELAITRSEFDSALGNEAEAVEQLHAADDLVQQSMRASSPDGATKVPDPALLRLRIDLLLRLSRALAVLGEEASASQPLNEAQHLCDRYGLLADRARCYVAAAERGERMGDRGGAAGLWRLASNQAREIGDIGASETYDSRAARLESVSVVGAVAR